MEPSAPSRPLWPPCKKQTDYAQRRRARPSAFLLSAAAPSASRRRPLAICWLVRAVFFGRPTPDFPVFFMTPSFLAYGMPAVRSGRAPFFFALLLRERTKAPPQRAEGLSRPTPKLFRLPRGSPRWPLQLVDAPSEICEAVAHRDELPVMLKSQAALLLHHPGFDDSDARCQVLQFRLDSLEIRFFELHDTLPRFPAAEKGDARR